jgi:hypothetical protein
MTQLESALSQAQDLLSGEWLILNPRLMRRVQQASTAIADALTILENEQAKDSDRE